LTLTELALLHLRIQQLDACKQFTEEASAILDTISGADPIVYSSYYRALSVYYKVKVAPTEFYRNSLMYLVYTPIETIPLSEQQSLAFDMGIAALISPDIYNFGELVKLLLLC
jgi:26S proteasome regulatory subunit N9